jgi:aryl-alcohol dehydrogenase-like predicted oxidoreductase
MLTRRLGRTDLELSVIGFGAWAIGGGGWKFGWGSQEDSQSIAAIQAALELGVNWIDTARVYGLGHSEQVVRAALDEYGASPYLVTKCTRVWDAAGEISGSMRRDSIRRELDASVEALGGRTIDLYLIHQPMPDEEIEEGWTTLNELKQEGLVRHIGVSNFSASQLKRAEAIAPVDALQPRYSLIHRDIEADLLPYCAERQIGTIVYSPMGSGLLTGRITAERVAALEDDDWRRTHADFQQPALAENLGLAAKLARIGGARGRSAGAMACAWTLGNPLVSACIVGFRSPEQVLDVLGPDGFALDGAALAEVRAAVVAR